MNRGKRDIQMLAFYGNRIKFCFIRLPVKDGQMIFPFPQRCFCPLRIRRYLGRNGHTFIDLRKQGDEIRDQYRGAKAHEDRALFSVNIPELLDHGSLLEKEVPGIADSQFSIIVQRDPAFMTVKKLDAKLVFQPLHGAAECRLGDMELVRRRGQSATGGKSNKLFK